MKKIIEKKEAKTLFTRSSFSLILLTFKAQRKEISKLSHHVSNGIRSHHRCRRLLRVVVVVVRNARFCIVFLPSRVSGFCSLHFNFTISDL